MQKNSAKVQEYFNSNPKLDTLYFTADGLAFKEQNDANAQAAKLVKAKGNGFGTVTTITRTEAFAADTTAPATPPPASLTPLEQAQANKAAADVAVSTAKTGMDQAQVTLDQAVATKQGSSATGSALAQLTKAVNNATKALADTKSIYDNAVLDASTAADALAALTPSA